MNLKVLYDDYHRRSGEQQSKVNHLVAASLIYIISHYFAPMTNDFVLTITCKRQHTCVFYNDMLGKCFADWNGWPVQIVYVQTLHAEKRVEGNRRYNMILTDSYDSFLEADFSSYTQHNSFNEYYYIFLQQRGAFLQQDMQKIFDYCWLHYLINCVIQIQNAKGESLVYTYYPFTALTCNLVDVVLINQFNGTSLVKKDIFPKKLTNLYGCPLKVALWDVPPYVHLSSNSWGQSSIEGGFEGELLLGLSQQMNFTLDIRVPANNQQRGVVMPNGTLTGAIKMLHDREADLSIGSFRQSSQRGEVATSTINYYQSTMSLVAVEDIYMLTSVETLLYPFNQTLWILLLCMVLVAVGIVATLKRIYKKQIPKNTSMSTMDVLLLLMGMPAIYCPKGTVTRILNVTWMIYALLLRTTYQALLFHMIRKHITIDVPQSLYELPQRGYTMVMNRQASAVLSNVPALRIINMITINSSSEFSAIEFLESLSLTEAENYVAVMPLDFIKYYMHVKRRAGVFRIFPYPVMLFKVCIYLTKHSYLIEQFDEMLMWIQGSGLIESWSRQVLGRSYANKPMERGDRPFGLAQLKMAFVSLIYCHALAILVFTAELLYKKLRCCGRFIKK